MSGRLTAAIVVGIAVISMGVCWLFSGDRDQKPAPDRSGSSELETRDTDRDAGARIASPATPTLSDARGSAGAPVLPATPTPADEFAHQFRDVDWAAPTEAELKKRWKQVRGGALDHVECHQSQCELTIVGSQRDVGKSIADLEGARGLHGYASSLFLSSPEKKPDGTIVLRAYATFER